MKPTALGLGGGHLGYPGQSDENAVNTIRGRLNAVLISLTHLRFTESVSDVLASHWQEDGEKGSTYKRK